MHMNQKGLAPVGIILIVMVVLAAIPGVWYVKSGKSNFFPNNQNFSNSQAVPIVKTFCDNFFKGPPALNEQGVMVAFSLLSQKAKQSMTVVGPSPSAALAAFAGVQDVPDKGYTIYMVSEGAEKATIKTTWKYTSGPITKTFVLEKENGSWKINAIN